MPLPKAKTISLTPEEVQVLITALDSRFSWLSRPFVGTGDNYPFTEMDTIDDIIEKLRED